MFLAKYTDEQIAEFIRNSHNYAELCDCFGISRNSGANRSLLSQYIQEHNISIDHFDKFHYRTDEEIFCSNSNVSQHALRERCIKKNNFPYVCAICGLEPVWNNKPLSLTLDHIDGDNRNNILSNLRWLCPNCDRQQHTFGSKKNKKEYRCIKCNKLLLEKRTTGLCSDCYKKSMEEKRGAVPIWPNQHKFDQCPICGSPKKTHAQKCRKCYINSKRKEIPPKDELIEQISKLGSYQKVAKYYNTSAKLLKKWRAYYNLD